ncbi:phage integrase SAM-like domain-containing protein [Sinorhizobium fredii]|uniref:phage integrase SAM-like domain-containing protein n=1 Tax=Rhizobium fredii TaxID=380 RepID=UPI000687A669|nr:phage integrase SAM-like domain-containing protein [Sinorhizobium fredii]
MTGPRTMLSLAKDYLSERRALGFVLRMEGHQITSFALFADKRGYSGPLTNDIVLHWVQGRAKSASPLLMGPAYRDTFRLLLYFAEATIGKAPTRLTLAYLDAQLLLSFLDHLEKERSNGARTRNARLAALRSFLKYAVHYDLTALPVIEQVVGHSDETVRPAGPRISVTRGDAGDP